MTRRIKINAINEIKKFVSRAEKYGDGLIVKSDTSACPACSLMSILSLIDISNGAKLVFDDEIVSKIDADFSEWYED